MYNATDLILSEAKNTKEEEFAIIFGKTLLLLFLIIIFFYFLMQLVTFLFELKMQNTNFELSLLFLFFICSILAFIVLINFVPLKPQTDVAGLLYQLGNYELHRALSIEERQVLISKCMEEFFCNLNKKKYNFEAINQFAENHMKK